MMTNRFWRLSHKNGDYGDMIAGFKIVMKMIGIDLGPPRLPIRPFDQERTLALHNSFRAIGFFKWIGIAECH